MGVGGLLGGVAAVTQGGDFWRGFAHAAAWSAAGYVLSSVLNEDVQSWTQEMKREHIEALISWMDANKISTDYFLHKYDPTHGDPDYCGYLRNLEVETTLGMTDIDWALTLANASNKSGASPSYLYNRAKLYWAFKDEGGRLFFPHIKQFHCTAENNAILMAEQLVSGSKTFKDFFPTSVLDKIYTPPGGIISTPSTQQPKMPTNQR